MFMYMQLQVHEQSNYGTCHVWQWDVPNEPKHLQKIGIGTAFVFKKTLSLQVNLHTFQNSGVKEVNEVKGDKGQYLLDVVRIPSWIWLQKLLSFNFPKRTK